MVELVELVVGYLRVYKMSLQKYYSVLFHTGTIVLLQTRPLKERQKIEKLIRVDNVSVVNEWPFLCWPNSFVHLSGCEAV